MNANGSIPSLRHRVEKELEQRSISFPCLYLTVRRNPVVLHGQHHKRQEAEYLFTSAHICVSYAFSVARKVLALAEAAQQKTPDLRAVIKADSAVPHGRVIHVLDLLKQGHVNKIAFGVTPVPPLIQGGAAPAPAPAPPK